MTYYTRHTRPNKKKHLKCQFFISVFKWFWVVECWWPSKEVFFNTLFPPFGTEKGMKAKNLSPGKIWQHARKQNMVTGGHDDILEGRWRVVSCQKLYQFVSTLLGPWRKDYLCIDLGLQHLKREVVWTLW